MKKLLLLFTLLTASVLSSCSDEPTAPSASSNCNCGTIANDGIDGNCYWLEIRNSCSGNKKIFCFDQDIWMDAYVGENFCVANQSW